MRILLVVLLVSVSALVKAGDLPINTKLGGDFELTSTVAERGRLSDFKGKVVLLNFGYTSCPDICPMVLNRMAAVMNELDEDRARVQPVFITFDPERDTPEVMNDYVTAMSERIVGITGDVESVAALVKSWRVYAEKVPEVGAIDGMGNYNMDHTASVLLVRADGSLQGTITYGENTQVALDKIRLLLKK